MHYSKRIMSDRHTSHHHHNHNHHRHRHSRQTFEEKYRILDNELKRKNDTIDSLRYLILFQKMKEMVFI